MTSNRLVRATTQQTNKKKLSRKKCMKSLTCLNVYFVCDECDTSVPKVNKIDRMRKKDDVFISLCLFLHETFSD